MLQTPKVHLLHEIFNSRFSQYSLLHHSIRETLKVLCKMFTVCTSLFSSTLKNIFCPFIASSIWKYRILFQFWGKGEQVFHPFCSCVRRLFSSMMGLFHPCDETFADVYVRLLPPTKSLYHTVSPLEWTHPDLAYKWASHIMLRQFQINEKYENKYVKIASRGQRYFITFKLSCSSIS